MEIHQVIDEFRKERNFAYYLPVFRENKQLCKALFRLVEEREAYPYADYASWIITRLAKKYPDFTQQYYKQLVNFVFETQNQSVLRNLISALGLLKPEDYRESELIDLLIGFLLNPANKIALHVHSIYLLIPLIKKYPELKPEIDQVLKIKREELSPALRVAIRNYHQKLK